MIVTILPSGNGGFHAVAYNERKVREGKAQLLEMRNFGAVGKFGTYTVEEAVSYLQAYTSSNDRIQKPQFHVAISCKGHELTEDQLLDFAHKYLDEMGYGQDGQPLLAYAHRDTDNTHIHIITSRIDPHGNKIDHNNERIRSQKVIEKLMGKDVKQEAEQDVETAKGYSVASLTQFKAVLNSLGYEAYDKNETLSVKKNGMVQVKIPIAELEPLYKKQVRYWKRNAQLRAILIKYRDLSLDKDQLKDALKKNFGNDLVFFGKKDSPSGYAIVDHKNKTVMHGNSILDIKELLDFSPIEQKLSKAEEFIRKQLEANPKITQKELNKKLTRASMIIKQGAICQLGTDNSLFMSQDIREQIKINNAIHLVEQFHPTTDKERAILCKFFRIEEDEESVSLSASDENRDSFINDIGDVFMEHEGQELRARLRGMGIIIKRDGEDVFAIDFGKRRIVDLRAEGFDVKRLETPKHNHSQKQKTNPRMISRGGRGGESGGHSQNREWEVGTYGRYGEVDDKIDTGLRY